MNHTKLTSALQMLTLRTAKYKISTKSHFQSGSAGSLLFTCGFKTTT